MTVVVLSSARELLGTPEVEPASPFGQMTTVLTPVSCDTVAVIVAPAGIVRAVPFGTLKVTMVGTVVLLLGVTDCDSVALRPPELDVSVTVMLRAPVPPFRESHRRTGIVPTGMTSCFCSAGVNVQ